MKTVRKQLSVLVIEDNPGDFALVEEFLLDQVPELKLLHAKNCKEAIDGLSAPVNHFDVVLLDLSLPDKTGIPLIKEIVDLSMGMPVIVLTGYTDLVFGINSLSLGVSDYILKEELNPALLLKSILYAIERKKVITDLEISEREYSELFHLSPQPMYVLDIATLHFLDVNDAALSFYGYSLEDFYQMNIKDISPEHEWQKLDELFGECKPGGPVSYKGNFIQQMRNGKICKVDIQSNFIQYKGKKALVALAIDMTERLNYIKAIERQNKKLREISWVQSHVVRAPLARIMGLVQLFKEANDNDERACMLEFLTISTNELDQAIKNITQITVSSEQERKLLVKKNTKKERLTMV